MEIPAFLVVLVIVAGTLYLYNRDSEKRSWFLRNGRDEKPSRSEAYAESEKNWVAPGDRVSVQGREISDGMVYVGPSMKPLSGWGVADPALIDPTLPADAENPDRTGENLDYWPSYSDIPPSSRAAYLNWLTSGRRDPDIHIGYVFLFFYGLERRVLLDAPRSEVAAAEIPALLKEVDALREVYAEQDGSFNGYSGSFVEFVRLVHGVDRPTEEPAEWTGSGRSRSSVEARVALAGRIADGAPVPPEWALTWFRTERSGELRTPATRCREEFDRLFQIRYRERFGTGLVVEQKGEPLTVEYAPATRSIRDQIRMPADGIVDVSTLTGPLAQLSELAGKVEEELDDYSRWIGRREDRGSPAATALLPGPLVRDFAGEEARRLARHFHQRIEDQEYIRETDHAILPTSWFVRRWPTENPDSMTGKEAECFARFLEGFGLGMEPDIRYTRSPSRQTHIAIFRLPDEPESPGERFHAARVLLHLTAAVATADDEITEDEEHRLEAHLEEALDLTASERARLRAYHARRLLDRPTPRDVRFRAKELTQRQRQELARFLAAVAGADGHLESGEVQILNQIHRALDLEPDAVHPDLYDRSARPPEAREPVLAVEAGRNEHSYDSSQPEEEDSGTDPRREGAPRPDEGFSRDEGVPPEMDRLATVEAGSRTLSPELVALLADDGAPTARRDEESER